MDDGKIRVLLIDDDPDDYYLTRDLLADLPGERIVLEWASAFDAGLEQLTLCEHDAYLLDYRLDKGDGLELLREGVRRGCKAPAIMLTGQGERELALEALEAGAADYLVKGQIDSSALERSIRYALQKKHYADELERKVAERTAELERANAALRAGEQALQEADRRKDDFLATLAHELRNPLAPLSNGLQLLNMMDAADPDAAQVKQMLTRQVEHMVRLVDDLMDVARITRGKIELRKTRVDLATILRNALDVSRPLIKSARHELTVTLPPEPITLEADSVRLAQVVANLLTNAAKYTPDGGQIWLTAEIETSEPRKGASREKSEAGEAPAALVIRVRDSGIGIAPEMLSKVFEMFSQIDRSAYRSQGGLGIGLSLVKSLVEMHEGSVRAESAGLGQGSEFSVRLPLAY